MEKRTCVLLFALALIQCSLAFKVRIAGGKFADIKDYPYLASLIDYSEDSDSRGEPVCGATIITDTWLITAGHCLKNWTANELKVRTGATQRYKDGEEHDIAELIVHPEFEHHEYVMSGDIGLVKLSKPIKFSAKQKPVKLAQMSDEPTPGKIVTISGFGKEEPYEEKKTLRLKAAFLPVVNLTKCQDDYFLDPVTDKMICAGNSGDSSCKGDSGGPGIIDGKLAAIVSSGFVCDTTNVPAVFTAVNKYLDWISKYVH